MKCVAVAPIQVRLNPQLPEDDSSLSIGEDDITKKLKLIMSNNQKLKEKLDHPDHLQFDARRALETAVHEHTMLLMGRQKGKEGRLRGNLQGKRGHLTASGVSTPDESLKPWQVGIPHSVARELTRPIFVTKENMEELQPIHGRRSRREDRVIGANAVTRGN